MGSTSSPGKPSKLDPESPLSPSMGGHMQENRITPAGLMRAFFLLKVCLVVVAGVGSRALDEGSQRRSRGAQRASSERPHRVCMHWGEEP